MGRSMAKALTQEATAAFFKDNGKKANEAELEGCSKGLSLSKGDGKMINLSKNREMHHYLILVTIYWVVYNNN